MKCIQRLLRQGNTLLGLVLAGILLSGCVTYTSYDDGFAELPPGAAAPGAAGPYAAEGDSSEVLRSGDLLVLVFSDTPTPFPPFEERIKEDGTITLVYNQSFVAAGRTRGELEKAIRSHYVPDYFKNLTVTIKTPERFYFVGGEVRFPSRQPYPGEMTVLKAIASVQGFTDFANKKKVRLTRTNGKTYIVNCVDALKKPHLDLPVYPGDKIHVPRRLW